MVYSSKLKIAAGMICSMALVAVWQLLWFNRFIGVEGWFSANAHLMMQGKILYKDIYFFAPPLYQYLFTFLIKHFGYGLIVLRIYGVIERVVFAGALYLLYQKAFPIKYVILLTVVSVVLYASLAYDTVAGYLQACIIFDLLSVYFIITALSTTKKRDFLIWIFAAGFSASVGLFIKQSTGLIVPFFMFLALSLILLRTDRKALLPAILSYSAGFVLLAIIVCAPMYINGSLSYFIKEVYTGAAGCKAGSMTALLFAGVLRSILSVPFVIFIIFMSIYYIKNRYALKPFTIESEDKLGTHHENRQDWRWITGTSIGFVLAISFAWMSAKYPDLVLMDAFLYMIVHWTFYATILICVYLTYKLLKSLSWDESHSVRYLLSILAIAVLYSISLSWNIINWAVVPAFGLVVGTVLTAKPINEKRNLALIEICFFLIVFCSIVKHQTPYAWEGWNEPPISAATKWSTVPGLTGMKISPRTDMMMKNVCRIIEDNTSSDDNIYAFPHLTLFYILTDRYPNTFATCHYFDICPDSCAEEDAERLSNSPPKVIIDFRMPSTHWERVERIYRDGRLCGARKLEGVINKLTSTNKYVLKASYNLGKNDPNSKTPYYLNVWVKTANKTQTMAFSANN